MTTREFTIDELEDMDAAYNAIHTEIVDQRRWYDVSKIVFEHEGTHWQATYRSPSTEIQEMDARQRWGVDPVTAVEVARTPVITLAWQPVPDDPMDTDDPLITAAEIAEALTGGDNDFNETLEGWLSMGAEGSVISGVFKAADELNPGDGDHAKVEWHAVVALGPAPKVGA